LTSNKNNQTQSQNQQQNVNQYIDFIPGFAKRKEAFDKAPPLRNGRKFPYIEEPLEISYHNFLKEVRNAADPDSTYYPPKDEKNNPVNLPNNCKNVVLRIIRHRLPSNEEVLTSFSQVIGYDYYGNKKVFTVDQPQKWTKPIFSTIRDYNHKKKVIETYSNGPTGAEEVFDMPFTPENVDKLYAQRPDGNPYFTPNARGFQRVSFYIKDQQNGGQVKEVFWSSEKESLRLFKEMDFNSLWNSLYLPQAIREQMAMDRHGVVDNEKSDNGSTRRAGPTSTNTSAYT
jgi:hypothetical protein